MADMVTPFWATRDVRYSCCRGRRAALFVAHPRPQVRLDA